MISNEQPSRALVTPQENNSTIFELMQLLYTLDYTTVKQQQRLLKGNK